jgi:hypothetical protein
LLACANDALPDVAERDAGVDARAPQPADAAPAPDAQPDAEPQPLDRDPAVAAFRAALEAGRYDALPDVLEQLASADRARPDDAEIKLALGLANLWGVVELGRDPQAPPSQAGGYALEAQAHLKRARELSPDDGRIDGWIGSISIGIGTNLSSPELVQEGYDEIARGVVRDPAFNLFVQAFQHARKAPDDPDFARAAQAFFEAVELCELGATRDAPQLATASTGRAAGVSIVCSNGPKMPHNLEGFWLFGGDILLKAGELATARALYENALLEGRAHGWPYLAVAEQRIDDAAAWARLLGDADADNDPQLAWDAPNQCVLCHER